jgi:hypothetical protein
MRPIQPQTLQRRQFLQVGAGLAAGALGAVRGHADGLPGNNNPRAIFGDSAEPSWKDQITVTVGPSKADLVGTTDKVVQAAVDYVARKGGGTVRILPGSYRLRNSIFLQSWVLQTDDNVELAFAVLLHDTAR